jgi:hypothetical protein
MPPLTDEFLQRLLDPITPAANQQEFAERNDTDFAYEIQGLAVSAATSSRIAKAAARCFASSRPKS